jgi:hypothetical protein
MTHAIHPTHAIGDSGCVFHEHCIIHDDDEPDLPGDYRVCGECRHVFRTPEELVAVESEKFGDYNRTVVGGEVQPPMWSCPHCAHDF